MLHIEVDDGKATKTEKDLLRELEIRYPNIYNRRRERKARQDVLQLATKGSNQNHHFCHESRGADVTSRRHSLAAVKGKDELQTGSRGFSRRNQMGGELRTDSALRRIDQRRNTSPEVKFETSRPQTLKERLQRNAERLNDILYNKSPFTSKSPMVTPRENGQVTSGNLKTHETKENQVHGSSDRDDGVKQAPKLTNGRVHKGNNSFNTVCQRILDNHEKERNSDFLFNIRWKRNSECQAFPKSPENSAVPVTLKSPLQSPVSQADSAIDLESVSLQPEILSDDHEEHSSSEMCPSDYNMKYSDTSEMEKQELSPFGGSSQWQSNETRSRPLHSLPNFVGDLAIRSLLSLSTDKEHSSGDESAPVSPDTPRSPLSLSPLVSPKKLKLQGQTPPKRFGPMRADHSLYSSNSSIPNTERELEEIYLRTHGFANSSPASVFHSSDEADDSVDDTDPTREDPKSLHSAGVSAKKPRHVRQQVYLVKTASDSPRYGRVTPVSAHSDSEGSAVSARGILLDMRGNHSLDDSKSVSYGKGRADSGMISDPKSLKSRSLSDVFEGDMESRFKMVFENGGPHFLSEHKGNEYCSSTDSPIKNQSFVSFDNFTLSPRAGTEEEKLTIFMDDIGESKTEDHVSEDSRVAPKADWGSVSDQTNPSPESKSSSVQECNPRKYSSQLKIFPQISGKDVDTEDKVSLEGKVKNLTSEPRRDDSLNTESDRLDQSFSSRASDCDTEFFMEAEFLDSAMKPKKTRLQKIFGVKKGKYNPATEDIPHLATAPQTQSKSGVVSKSMPHVCSWKQTDNLEQEDVQAKRSECLSGGETHEHHKAAHNVKSVYLKDVRFSVVENKDDSCVESFSGSLLRAGRINAYEAAALTEKHKPIEGLLEDSTEHIVHARPVVISSGKGSCLDLGVSDFKTDPRTLDIVKECVCEDDEDSEVFEIKTDSPRSMSASDTSSVSVTVNSVPAPPVPTSSFLSEGFEYHESFENKFHQELNLNASGSEFGSSHTTSHSPRSVWSECDGLQLVDQSFEDDFDSSFMPQISEVKSLPRDKSDIKEEKEKSSGYGSENSRQTSETKDESLTDDDPKQELPSALNDDDLDRIFELAKDPPSFGDDSVIEEELPFEILNQQYCAPTKIASEVIEENGLTDSEPSKFSAARETDDVPKPTYSHHSPRVASTKYKSSKQADDIFSSSVCSDETDGTSTASRHQDSDDMGMSSESEVIRSAFDFLGSSSDVETMTSARETLMMLEEEEESEEEDLAASIKILSDLRKSIISENEDILFAQEIQDDQDAVEVHEEDIKPTTPQAISEDEDSSFQMDPRPAGVHCEIQVDIHRPNMEDSDNGSEMDAPVDALEDDDIGQGDPVLCPGDQDATTPCPEDFMDESVHPLNRTFTISDKCEDTAAMEGVSSTNIVDELKHPLWESDDQPLSEKSTPRAMNHPHSEEGMHDISLDASSISTSSSISLEDNDSTGITDREEARTPTMNYSSDKKDSLTLIKEEYGDKPKASTGHRYIKKSQMDRKKAFLRRQKEIIEEEDDDENNRRDMIQEGDTDSKETGDDGTDGRKHIKFWDKETFVDNNLCIGDIMGFNSEPEPNISGLVSDPSAVCDTADSSETSMSFASSFHRLSSVSGNYSDSVHEFSLDSTGNSPRSLTQTDLPDTSVILSDELNMSASSQEVWFDDLGKSQNPETNMVSILSPRANAYRKSSEGDDSKMSEESSSRPITTNQEPSLPDVVFATKTSPDVVQGQILSVHPSDQNMEEDLKRKFKSEDPYARISGEGTVVDDREEGKECPDLSFSSFISPYATTKSLAKISSTPKSLYGVQTAEISCDGIEPVYDPYATIDTSGGDNSTDSDKQCSSTSDISPYATVKDFSSLRLNEGVLFTSKELLIDKSAETFAETPSDEADGSVVRSIPEIRIQAPTDHEDEVEDDSQTDRDIADLYAKVKKIQSKGENSYIPAVEDNSLTQNHCSKGDDSITPLGSEELGACGGEEEFQDTEDEGPPLPQRKYNRSISSQSNLHSDRELSASRTSLFTNFKASAKVKFHTMRKAMSMDRGLDEVREDKKKAEKKEKAKEKNKKDKKEKKKKKEEKISKAPSLKSLTSIFSKKSRDRNSGVEGETQGKKDEAEKKGKKERGSIFKSKKKRLVTIPIEIVDTPTHFRCIGKLRAVNPDGTQIIELSKPAEGPIGFYIAKGTANYDYGTFVSRFSDDQQKLFAGILGVGDEILDINDHSVKDMSLDDVHALMAGTETLVMKVFPIVARKEV